MMDLLVSDPRQLQCVIGCSVRGRGEGSGHVQGHVTSVVDRSSQGVVGGWAFLPSNLVTSGSSLESNLDNKLEWNCGREKKTVV